MKIDKNKGDLKTKIRLCYRIEKESGLGEDEFGNPTEVYSSVKLNCRTYNVPKKQYKELVEAGRRIIDKNIKRTI